MANGYTYPVKEGLMTFGQFLWHCMGGKPRFEPCPYDFLLEWAANDDHRAAAIEAMSDAGLERHVASLRKGASEWAAKYNADKNHERANYEAMIAQVKAWDPPVGNERVKTSLLKELRDSLEIDCSGAPMEDPGPTYPAPNEWKREELSRLRDSAAKHRRDHAERVAETEQEHARMRALLDSVPFEEYPKNKE